jgi:hypothetical protein
MPSFELLRNADGIFQRRNEPYIVSLAIDERTGATRPAIDTNALPFPNVRVGSAVEMLGHGHLLYGPRHPRAWVALSALLMESGRHLWGLGRTVGSIVEARAANLAIKAILQAAPHYGTVLALLKELTGLVAQSLMANKDDELFRTEGMFLRDYAVPFDLDRSYVRSNEFLRAKLNVLAMSSSNGLAQPPNQVVL